MTDINFEKMQYTYLPSLDGGVNVYAFTKRQDRKMFTPPSSDGRYVYCIFSKLISVIF